MHIWSEFCHLKRFLVSSIVSLLSKLSPEVVSYSARVLVPTTSRRLVSIALERDIVYHIIYIRQASDRGYPDLGPATTIYILVRGNLHISTHQKCDWHPIFFLISKNRKYIHLEQEKFLFYMLPFISILFDDANYLASVRMCLLVWGFVCKRGGQSEAGMLKSRIQEAGIEIYILRYHWKGGILPHIFCSIKTSEQFPHKKAMK